jgi:hypothetical protein
MIEIKREAIGLPWRAKIKLTYDNGTVLYVKKGAELPKVIIEKIQKKPARKHSNTKG